MATLTYTTVSHLGATPTMAAASGGGDKIARHPSGVVVVRNGDASSKTVTVVVPGSAYGQARPDYTYVVTAGSTAFLGPFPDDLVDPTDGLVSLTYSAVTSVTVGAITF